MSYSMSQATSDEARQESEALAKLHIKTIKFKGFGLRASCLPVKALQQTVDNPSLYPRITQSITQFRELYNMLVRHVSEQNFLEDRLHRVLHPLFDPYMTIEQPGSGKPFEVSMSNHVTAIIPKIHAELPLRPGVFPFFSLPAELRNLVYDFYFTPEKIFATNLQAKIEDAALQLADERGPLVQLMYSNKDLRNEITGYIHKTFPEQSFVVDTYQTSLFRFRNTHIGREVWEMLSDWSEMVNKCQIFHNITIQVRPRMDLWKFKEDSYDWYNRKCQQGQLPLISNDAWNHIRGPIFVAFFLNFYIEPMDGFKNGKKLVLEFPYELMVKIADEAQTADKFPELLFELRRSCKGFKEIACQPLFPIKKSDTLLMGPEGETSKPYIAMAEYFKMVFDGV